MVTNIVFCYIFLVLYLLVIFNHIIREIISLGIIHDQTLQRGKAVTKKKTETYLEFPISWALSYLPYQFSLCIF